MRKFKKIISVTIILAIVMSLGMSVVTATASSLIAPTEVVTLDRSGPSNNQANWTWTINGETVTRQQHDARISQIYQGATVRLISFDAPRRSGTSESSGSMTRSAAIASLNNGQAWGAAYSAILNAVTCSDFAWAGNSVAIHDITGNGTPELVFAAGSGRIDFFVYSFDGSNANRIIFIEGLEHHVSNNNHDAYVTSDGTLIVRGGNAGDDGIDHWSGETFHIFRNLGSPQAPPTTQQPPAPPQQPPAGAATAAGTLTFDVPPMLVDGRVLVPMRGIFEALGAEVDWNAATQTATGTKDGIEVVLTIGSRSPTVNGRVVPIDVPGIITGGRTLVPLRFIAESLGVAVDWNAATQMVTITSDSVGVLTVMVVSEPIRTPAPARPAEPAISGFILPHSSTRPLTEADLRGLTANELVIARNEIYARHGRRFRTAWIQAHFDAQAWYTPTLPLGVEPVLSSLEHANIAMILRFEGR